MTLSDESEEKLKKWAKENGIDEDSDALVGTLINYFNVKSGKESVKQSIFCVDREQHEYVIKISRKDTDDKIVYPVDCISRLILMLQAAASSISLHSEWHETVR